MFILTDTKSSAVNQTLAKVFLPCDYCGFCPSESSWLQREEEPQFLFHFKICLREAKQSNYVCLVQTLQIYASFPYVFGQKITQELLHLTFLDSPVKFLGVCLQEGEELLEA